MPLPALKNVYPQSWVFRLRAPSAHRAVSAAPAGWRHQRASRHRHIIGRLQYLARTGVEFILPIIHHPGEQEEPRPSIRPRGRCPRPTQQQNSRQICDLCHCSRKSRNQSLKAFEPTYFHSLKDPIFAFANVTITEFHPLANESWHSRRHQTRSQSEQAVRGLEHRPTI
jgi:hypothetical protein